MKQIVTCDIGGTHARFAIAKLGGGHPPELSDPIILRTGEYLGFHAAWEEFGSRLDQAIPRDLAIAFAGPVKGEALQLTNSSWLIRPDDLHQQLGLARLTIVNDFGAVAHALPWLDEGDFHHICGPAQPLPETGIVTVIGPGTGLGVALLLRRHGGGDEVIETEGGHIDFAPIDELDDHILAELRKKFGRVSAERLVSGPGLMNIYEQLCAIESRPPALRDEKSLWSQAIEGSDRLAATALDRFCLGFGAIAGDLALAQGAKGVAIGGGIGLRLAAVLQRSGFSDRFIAKGRFSGRMKSMPVKLVTFAHPGLLGAAAAFAKEHY